MNFDVNGAYEDFWTDQTRFLIAYGGAGSSKSYSTAQKILSRIMTEEDHRYLVARKVAATLRVSVFQLFKELIYKLGIEDRFKINKSDMTITYLPNRSVLMFFGLDNIEKLKSIQGITSMWVEEASECVENDIAELNRRLRGETKYYKQIIITFNPISHLHWLKKRFFDNPASTAAIYKSTYKDNAFIDDEYKREIEDTKNYDIQQYNIYALGDWGVLSTNIVYNNYNFNKHISYNEVEDFGVLYCGIDFNIGGCVCVVCGIAGDEVHVVDAFASYDTDAMVSQLLTYKDKTMVLFPDASGRNRSTNASRSDVQILRDAGFRIDAAKTNGPVRDRINSVNKKFALGQLLLSKKVDKLSFALQTQTYKENGDPEKFGDHDGGSIDDYNDALGYMVSRKFPLHKQTVKRLELSFG